MKKQLVHFFSIKGRLGRKKYFLYCVILLSSALLIGAVSDNYMFTGAILVLYIAFIFQTIKRLHDINLSGWWALLVLIPVINILAGAWVLLKKGTKGENKYSLN